MGLEIIGSGAGQQGQSAPDETAPPPARWRDGDEADLREYADRMAEAEQIIRFGVFRWELDTGCVRWSDQLHRIYGLEPGTFAGTVDAFIELLHPDSRAHVWACVQRSLETLEPFLYEERIVRADGQVRTLLSQGRPIVEGDGRAHAVVGVCHDVTDRVQAQQALGLSERRMRAIIDYSPSVIAVKDLDGRYLMSNAETGRLLGVPADTVIGRPCSAVFPTISEQMRVADHLAAVDMQPVHDEVELIVDGVRRTFATVTFALPDDAGDPIETCTIATDVTERHEPPKERRARLEWGRRIRSALDDGRMLTYGQPVFDLATGDRIGLELLVRMRAARDGEVLAPGTFLPASERYGLVQAIDIWMVRRALALDSREPLAVNLSAVTLCDSAARGEILRLIGEPADAARQLVLEITETAAAANLDQSIEFATALTELGCALALDDFGTGFGTFTYLRSLPLRYLKIDRSFVSQIEHSRDDRRIVGCIIDIARQFELISIAEGVENESTLSAVRELGADYAQGFHLGRPGPVG